MPRAIVYASIPALCTAAMAQSAKRSPDHPMAEPPSNVRWHKLVEYQRAQLNVRRADLCFVGDSLTEAWQQEGASAWRLMVQGSRAVNCGIAGDRTEHVLFRLGRLNLERAKPRVVVLWLGTNNLSADQPDSPDSVARAIDAAIASVSRASPETKIVVLSLSPNGLEPDSPLQRAVKETNRLLAQRMSAGDAILIDVQPALAKTNGAWKAECTIDGTHLSARGYDQLAELLKSELRPLLNPTKP